MDQVPQQRRGLNYDLDILNSFAFGHFPILFINPMMSDFRNFHIKNCILIGHKLRWVPIDQAYRENPHSGKLRWPLSKTENEDFITN